MSLCSRREQPGESLPGDLEIEDLLAKIEIPSPFDLQVFCDGIAAERGRRLFLHSAQGISGSEAPCGIWIATESSDHVFYEAATSPLHRDHIILHEIAHMLLGHTSILDAIGESGRGLFADIDPKTIVGFLGRASYNSKDEQAAERLASRIADRAGPPSRNRSTASSQVLRRLGRALGSS